MKVKEFIEKAKKYDGNYTFLDGSGRLYSECMIANMDIWDSYACLGYLLVACKEVSLDDDTKRDLLHAMQYAFDVLTVDQASTRYDDEMGW